MSYQLMIESDIKNWAGEYTHYLTKNPTETRSCLVPLGDLEEIMSYIHEKNYSAYKNNREFGTKLELIDGIRIYLIRHDFGSQIIKLTEPITNKLNVPQITFAIVPTKNYSHHYLDKNGSSLHGGADNFIDPSGKIASIIPGFKPEGTSESSGLCPNNCGGE